MISTDATDGVVRTGPMKKYNQYDPTQQQHQQPQQHEWEYMKENSAPLQRGRNIVTLTNHHHRHHKSEEDGEMKQMNHTIQLYEERIKRQQLQQLSNDSAASAIATGTTADDDDLDRTDPLRIWVSYIKYIQDVVYPKSNPQSKSIFTLLERCVHTFCTVTIYQNDIRFIRICCLYADLTVEPLQTFYELWNTYRIGTQSAIYYNAWAFIAEKYHYYTIAEQIFQYGLYPPTSVTTVEPKEYLLLRYKRFQKRMSRYWRNLQQEQGLDQDMNDVSTYNTATSNSNSNSNNNDHSQQSRHIQELTNHYHHPNKNNQHRAILGPLSSTTHRHPQHQHVPSFLIPSSSSTITTRQRLPNIQPTFMDRTSTGRFTSQTTQNNSLSTLNQNQSQQGQESFTIFSDHMNGQPISEVDPQPEQLFFKKLSMAKTDTGTGTSTTTLNQHHRPTTEAERWKENHGQIEKWNEHGSLRSAYSDTNDSISNPLPVNNGNNNRQPYASIQSNTVVGFAIHIDDECIQQQQHEENERQEYTKQQRLARDDRTMDPINYKVSKNNTNRTEKSKDIKLPTKPMWRNRLLTNPITYDEQCFEESRFYNGQYKILHDDVMNINLLFVNNTAKKEHIQEQDDDDDNSNEMSMSMEELLTASINDESFGPTTTTSVANMTPNSIHRQQQQHQNNHKFQIETPVLNDHCRISTLRDQDVSYQNHNNTNNTSTASSTLDELKMFGNSINNNNNHNTHIQSNEPTINTQFALRELSFMFTSPVQPSESIPTEGHQQIISKRPHDIQANQNPIHTNNFQNNQNNPITFDIFNDEDVHDDNFILPVDSYRKKNEVNNLNFTIFDDESKSQQQQQQCQPNLEMTNQRTSSVPVVQTSTSNAFTIFCDDSTELILKKEVENNKSKPSMQTSPVSDQGMTIPLAVGDTAEFTISELQKWQEQSLLETERSLK
jgi:hypothetical protein